MTDQTTESIMQKNRKACRLLGICWNDNEGTIYNEPLCFHCGKHHDNPDFHAHPWELLRVLREREDWYKFFGDAPWNTQMSLIDDFILDRTGKLLHAAYQWFKEREGKNAES